MTEPRQQCPHCGRTSHGFVCCGWLAADEGRICAIDHTQDRTSHADEAHPPRHHRQGPYGPPRPLRAARSITPRGTTR